MTHLNHFQSHIMHKQRKDFRKFQQKSSTTFLSFGPFLGHFSSSGGSKKISMGDMMMSKVFKRLSQTRAFQRTSNRDITHRISEAKLQKTRKRPNLVFQSQLRLSKFLSFGPFLGHCSSSGGYEKFSMGDMIISKVFKRLPQIKAF